MTARGSGCRLRSRIVVGDEVAQGSVLREAEAGVGFEDGGGHVSSPVDEAGVREPFREAYTAEAALRGAEYVAGAAEFEVFFGDFEAVDGVAHDVELAAVVVARFGIAEEDAPGAVFAAADAAPELVELGEAVAFGVVDDHDGGVRNVYADFDDGGGDEDGCFVVPVLLHDGVFFFRVHAAVQEADGDVRELLLPVFVFGGGRGCFPFVVFFDERGDDVDLPPGFDLFAEEGFDFVQCFAGAEDGGDFAAAFGQFVDEGDVEVAVEGEGEGARDGGGGHDEYVGCVAPAYEFFPLLDSEFVLFVDDGEAEVARGVFLVEQGMGADDDFRFAVVGAFDVDVAVVAAVGGAEGEAYVERGEDAAEVVVMLFGEDLRGSHEDGLFAAFDGEEHGAEGDHGFAGAYVSLDEAVHGVRLFHVAVDFAYAAFLGGGAGEGEAVGEFLDEVGGGGGDLPRCAA